jgi:hypothetical protein
VSSLEWLGVEGVRNIEEELLIVGRFSSQGKDLKSSAAKIEFSAYESMSPMRGDGNDAGEEADVSFVIGSSEKDDEAFGPLLGKELPSFGKESSSWRSVAARGSRTSGGVDVALGLVEEAGERLEVKPSPDLCLPAAIEGLDVCLEAGFSGWREDRRDAEGKAESDDSAESVGVDVRAGEDGVIVELGVAGPAEACPTLDDGLEDGVGVDRFDHGPSVGQGAVQGNRGKNLDARSVLQGQSLDDIEGIEFDGSLCQEREIPALRRGRPAHASSGVEGATPSEDSSDGPHGGDVVKALFDQFSVDGFGAKLAEITGVEQVGTDGQDKLLHLGIGAMGSSRSERSIIPVDAIESLGGGPSHPQLHGCKSDMKFLSDGPH